jgi:4-amino-4-deoxy-L-arabinose transferase-like glycosyltransferase
LIATIAHFLRINWGLPHALAGSLLVFLLPFYNTLSVSVMQAVPVLTFALLSLLALSAWHQHPQERWLILSALALALSILTKLFIAYLVPIFVLGILLDARARLGKNASWIQVLRPAILWSLAFLVISGGLSLLLVGTSWSNFSQLLDTHLAASQTRTYAVMTNATPIVQLLGDAWPMLLLAIPGCFFVLLERRWTSIYLFTWLVLAYLMLTIIVPVRYHYQLLVTVPAAMLGAIATGEGLRQLVQGIRSHTFFNGRFALAIIALVPFLIVVNVRYPLVQPSFDRPPVFVTHGEHAPWPDQVFLTKMTNHAPQTRWIVTDIPLYAFRVGLPVPPHLVVASTKRFVTGALTEEDLMNFVREYNPEQVLTGNGSYPDLETFLENDYRLLYERGKRRLYLRKDLKGQ